MGTKLSDRLQKSCSPGRGKDLLSHDDFRGSLREHQEVSVLLLNHSAHGLADRVESVHLVEELLRPFLSHVFVVSTDGVHKAEQGTVGLVANLDGLTS